MEQFSKEQLIVIVGERNRVIREKKTYETQLLGLIDEFKRLAFELDAGTL